MKTEPLWRSVYPFASHYFATQSGVRLHYVDEGPADDGQASQHPIVCVHGNPTWSFYWRALIQRFSPERRVLALDHVGCGLSDKPQDYPYTLERRRDDLLAWCESLGLRRITLVAHDWGGPIGLSAWAAQPDRFERVVLLNTGAFPPPYVPWRIAACRIPVLGTLGVRGLNLFSRAAITMAMSRRSLSSEARAGLLAPYDSWANRVAVDRFVKDIPRSDRDPAMRLLRELESRLPQLPVIPILMVWGMRDWCFRPECLERLLQMLPHASAVRIEDAGHYVMEDATEEVLAAIGEFLARTDAKMR